VHHRPDIQGLRAVAVILVIAFHYNLGLSLGYLGVDLFFVISGYVISLSTIRNIRSEKRFNWKFFYRRRVRRLLPGAAIVAVVSALFALLALSPFGPQQKAATMLMSVATYSTNFALMKSNYYALDSASNPLLHFWSLAVEEQFYFLWGPLILAVVAINARRDRRSTRVALIICGVLVTVISLALFVLMSRYESTVMNWVGFKGLAKNGLLPSPLAFYSPLTRGWEFVAGVGIALVDSRTLRTNSRTSLAHFMAAIGLLLIICGISNCFGLWDSSTSLVIGLSPWAVIATVLGTSALLWAGNRRAFTNSIFALRPLTYLGDISYTLYLWHWPIWVFGIAIFGRNNWVVLFGLFLTLLVSVMQYHLVEDPFRSRLIFPRLNIFKTVISFGVVCTVATIGINVLSPKIGEKVAGTSTNFLSRHIVEEPCKGSRVIVGEATSCRFKENGSNGLWLLVGDSTAKSISDGFVATAKNLNKEVMVFFKPGCSFHTPQSKFAGYCKEWRQNVWSAITILNPEVVAVSNLNYLYVRDKPAPYTNIASARLAWAEETKATFTRLNALKSIGVLIQTVPETRFDIRYEASLLHQKRFKERRVNNRDNEFLNLMEKRALNKVPGKYAVIDLYPELCDDTNCVVEKEVGMLYEDSSHLSSIGSMYMARKLEYQLGRIAQN
jgi:peptidoglycan/LPS O-acetylase OafA/YrhL